MAEECEVRLTARGPKGAWTHILIPFDAAATFGRRGLIPVVGTLNGHRFRSSLTPEGAGRHYLAVNKAMQAGAKVRAGDPAHLALDLDCSERTVDPPAELEAALARQPAAGTAFTALSYSCRKEYADWIAGAKRQQTRDARAERAVAMLLDGKRSPNP